ncbi:cytochrome P450 4B1-like isoform X4 [Spea bombifrons]|uniref:cytochrome P450 4B1-like isoform X4 n=1 Tax=Spea bombifrons TaxID=233779 RepID=UPI002349C2BC|nr:cytochrome P450 4B1-like isoform X4 [Spea bombifrons]
MEPPVQSIISVDGYRLLHLGAVFCLSVVLLKGIQLYQRRKTLLAALQSFPGPPSHWLFGQANEFRQDGQDLDRMLSWGLQFPYANPVWFGPFIVYLNITHPEYARTLLSRTDPKDNVIYDHFIPWIGKGLLVLAGQKWFQHRRLLTPGFHYDVLKPYVRLMSDCTKVMLDSLQEQAAAESIDICPYVGLMTLDAIMKCAFSYDSNCQSDRENPYTNAVLERASLADGRELFSPCHSDLIFYLSPQGRLFQRASRISREHTDNVIKQRKESLKCEKEPEKIQEKRHLDFLDVLLCAHDENGQGLSDEELRAEVDTFIFEGHDTTASGISWIFYCMAKYPEHQQKCRREIREVLGERDTVEWNDLSLLPYTTMCIKESLRLYPPVPLLARQMNKPITFSDGRSVPEGCLVSVCIDSIHRNPDVWTNPEVFDPLRFSPEESSQRHSHAYLPFSAGPRNCIGQDFAMNEMKIAVALTLNTFELSLDPTQPPVKVLRLVLRSKNGIHLRLKKSK